MILDHRLLSLWELDTMCLHWLGPIPIEHMHDTCTHIVDWSYSIIRDLKPTAYIVSTWQSAWTQSIHSTDRFQYCTWERILEAIHNAGVGGSGLQD